MVDALNATRLEPLAYRHGGSGAATLMPAQPATRLSLRCRADAVSALSSVLGLDLPVRPRTSASANGRHALWLGPDEWLVIDEAQSDLIAACASANVLHSATDVSHRNTAILVTGAHAARVLNGACPLDLSLAEFPVGACTRTLLGKIQVVLYRTAEDTFRVECWRSYVGYAFSILAESAEDA